jgi:hypothetical protein
MRAPGGAPCPAGRTSAVSPRCAGRIVGSLAGEEVAGALVRFGRGPQPSQPGRTSPDS